jgi:hypothetical protein
MSHFEKVSINSKIFWEEIETHYNDIYKNFLLDKRPKPKTAREINIQIINFLSGN